MLSPRLYFFQPPGAPGFPCCVAASLHSASTSVFCASTQIQCSLIVWIPRYICQNPISK